MQQNLKNFYIPDDQSVYLLSTADAAKLRRWVELCKKQLNKLGYEKVELLGKGVFGFAFTGFNGQNQEHVFKFSRITLAPSVRERLEEEAYMLSLTDHPSIPKFLAYEKVKKQGILVMERGQGTDLQQYARHRGKLPVKTVVDIAWQLADLLRYLRDFKLNDQARPLVHGDIKPSNLVWDEISNQVSLIDWGSSVFSQLDITGNPVVSNVMDLMSSDMQNTNARLGDIYFIGDEQLNGGLSTPRFDEQGAAATIYALASGQNCRYGRQVIPASSLGLPESLGEVLDAMLSDNKKERDAAADNFVAQIHVAKHWILPDIYPKNESALLPVWTVAQGENKEVDSVAYSSRKSFLRSQQLTKDNLYKVNDEQLDRYYKNYLQGMGETEKAFVSAVSQLGDYPLVGGLAIHWTEKGISIDSSLRLFDKSLSKSLNEAVNNMVDLARALRLDEKDGIFKCCLFNAKQTLHYERENKSKPFLPNKSHKIEFEIVDTPGIDDSSRHHSYFEDGADPDEQLQLPEEIMRHIRALNEIHHTGCIIFEVLAEHMKVHNYYVLLDESKRKEFEFHLAQALINIQYIKGLGVSGFMKLPYKDTKHFAYQSERVDCHYPINPKLFIKQ